jgi:flagellar biosynthetic protein FlhB
MAEGSSGEKKHAPTARRLRQAAEKGDVRRSADFPKAAVIVITTTMAFSGTAGLGVQLANFCAAWLRDAGTAPPAAAAAWAGTTMLELFPLLALIAALAIATSIVSGGWVFSLTPLKPDLTKLLPTHGLGQLVSKSGLSETAKALLKFLIIGGTGAAMISLNIPDIAALAAVPLPSAAPVFALVLHVLAAICIAIAVLAAADLALQRWLHHSKLRMSDNELRDEMKDSGGNQQVRQRQRMLARKLARARQMRRIPEASVIVTNPSHFAVAIRYRRGTDHAPLLLAKGTGLLAAEIISRGRGLGIPIVQAPPLARAIHRHVEPGDPIPVALYRACAEVLAYVWKMQRWRGTGGQRPMPPKVQHGEIPVPCGR